MTASSFQFDVETAARLLDPNAESAERAERASNRGPSYGVDLTSNWNIGENPNGGYLTATSLQAMRQTAEQPDPLTVTTHFLRPGSGSAAGVVDTELIRPGRRSTTVTGQFHQGGKQRLQVVAAFGDLSTPSSSEVDHSLDLPPVDIPDPDDCVSRMGLEQGVDLPIMSRLDIRIDPKWSEAGSADHAEVSGWIRFSDGRPTDSLALTLFGDAFPPSLFSLLGRVGWVPTLELTVHVRRRPEPGWIRARFYTTDLHNGMLVENGELWDSTGKLVAQSRQLALLL